MDEAREGVKGAKLQITSLQYLSDELGRENSTLIQEIRVKEEELRAALKELDELNDAVVKSQNEADAELLENTLKYESKINDLQSRIRLLSSNKAQQRTLTGKVISSLRTPSSIYDALGIKVDGDGEKINTSLIETEFIKPIENMSERRLRTLLKSIDLPIQTVLGAFHNDKMELLKLYPPTGLKRPAGKEARNITIDQKRQKKLERRRKRVIRWDRKKAKISVEFDNLKAKKNDSDGFWCPNAYCNRFFQSKNWLERHVKLINQCPQSSIANFQRVNSKKRRMDCTSIFCKKSRLN